MKTVSIFNLMAVFPYFIIGYFDPDGIFFNVDGYDECGGYYDDDGVYREADYDKEGDEEIKEELKNHMEYLKNCVEGSKAESFKGLIMNIVGKTTLDDVKAELDKVSKDFGTVTIHPEEDESQTATIEVKSKEAAKALIELHGKKIFGDRVDVDFEEFMTEKEPVVELNKDEKTKKDLEEEGFEVEFAKKG